MTDLNDLTLADLEKIRSDWDSNKTELKLSDRNQDNFNSMEKDFEILYNLIFFHVTSK